jgi:hypothetical protein
MNTEQVTAMIDAITDGQETVFNWEGINLSDDLKLDIGTNGMGFLVGRERFDLNDSRVAREIAGALIAWADRKDGDPLSKTAQRQTVQTIVGDAWNEEVDTVDEDQEPLIDGKRNIVWREDWYRRNVGRMSRETMERNLEDLKVISKTTSAGSSDWDDIQKAMNILHDSLMGIKPPNV